jgi:hypothetical protein
MRREDPKSEGELSLLVRLHTPPPFLDPDLVTFLEAGNKH